MILIMVATVFLTCLGSAWGFVVSIWITKAGTGILVVAKIPITHSSSSFCTKISKALSRGIQPYIMSATFLLALSFCLSTQFRTMYLDSDSELLNMS
jgi:hypothetical protein